MGVIDLTPDPQLLVQIGLTQESAAHYLADLLDNAIDARGNQPARVDLTIAADRVVIRDYGDGMTEEQLKQALVLGRSTKSDSALGQYGFGMKSAMAALGRTSVITTAARGEGKTWVVRFEPHRLAQKRGPRRWQLEYHEVEEPGFGHGTRIEILEPNVATTDADLIAELRMTLGHIYGEMIRKGILLVTLNGKPLTTPELDLQVGPIPLKLYAYDHDGTEHEITGWVGITDKPRRVGRYGFDLMWRGRVIVPYDRLGRASHTSWNRLVGALHLDTLPPTQNKNDFLRDTLVFRSLQQTVWGGILDPVLEQIESINRAKRQARFEKRLANEEKRLNQRLCSPEALRAVQIAIMAQTDASVTLPAHLVLSCDMASLGAQNGPYVDEVVTEVGTMTIKIYFNLDHRLFRQDPRNVIKWMPGAAVDVIAMTLAGARTSETLDPRLYATIRQELQVLLSTEPPRGDKKGKGAGEAAEPEATGLDAADLAG